MHWGRSDQIRVNAPEKAGPDPSQIRFRHARSESFPSENRVGPGRASGNRVGPGRAGAGRQEEREQRLREEQEARLRQEQVRTVIYHALFICV